MALYKVNSPYDSAVRGMQGAAQTSAGMTRKQGEQKQDKSFGGALGSMIMGGGMGIGAADMFSGGNATKAMWAGVNGLFDSAAGATGAGVVGGGAAGATGAAEVGAAATAAGTAATTAAGTGAATAGTAATTAATTAAGAAGPIGWGLLGAGALLGLASYYL